MTGAAIGSAIGGIGGLIMGNQASQDAKGARNEQLRLQQQQMAFSQGQLDDWEDMFGGIEQNLTDYYNDLDPTKFAMEGKQNLQMSMNKQMKQFNDTMASQGMQTSGMKAQAAKEAAFGVAQGNAAIDLAAPEQVNQMKQGYLASKEGRRSQALGGITNSYNQQQATQGQYANQLQQSQAGYMGMAGNMFGSAIGLGINTPTKQGGFSDYGMPNTNIGGLPSIKF